MSSEKLPEVDTPSPVTYFGLAIGVIRPIFGRQVRKDVGCLQRLQYFTV